MGLSWVRVGQNPMTSDLIREGDLRAHRHMPKGEGHETAKAETGVIHLAASGAKDC